MNDSTQFLNSQVIYMTRDNMTKLMKLLKKTDSDKVDDTGILQIKRYSVFYFNIDRMTSEEDICRLILNEFKISECSSEKTFKVWILSTNNILLSSIKAEFVLNRLSFKYSNKIRMINVENNEIIGDYINDFDSIGDMVSLDLNDISKLIRTSIYISD